MEKNILQAFKVAIHAEHTAEKLYLGLEKKFAQRTEIASFWRKYAQEEAQHAKWLENLEANTTTDELASPVDQHTVALMKSVTQFPLDYALENVKDLEDAYQLVMELENGETNAIFQFLLNHFEPDARIRDFISAQLNRHIARLSNEFPSNYRSIIIRRNIKAAE